MVQHDYINASRHAQSVMGPKYSNDEGSGLCIIAYRYTSTTVSFPLNAIAARLIKRQFESPTIFHCAVMQLFFFTNKLKNFIAQRSMMSFVTASKKDCWRKVGGKYLFITKFEKSKFLNEPLYSFNRFLRFFNLATLLLRLHSTSSSFKHN